MLNPLSRVLLVVALGACASGPPPAPFRSLDAPPSPHRPPPELPVKEHAIHGALIRDAVARGDIPAVRRSAKELVALATEDGHNTPQTRLGAMIVAAQDLRAAHDLREAARGLAILAERCGACHKAFGGPNSFPASPPPSASNIEARMRRHHWGAARLWEGLVAPSDEAWSSGAGVLSEPAIDPGLATPGRSPTPAIAALSASVRELGLRAAATLDGPSRVEIYGELMATCAQCHERVGGGPPPPK